MNELIDDAKAERERQRSESEARAIIHDLDKLYTFEEEKKARWIWELLQNAKDVANEGGIDIRIKHTPDELSFSHNGMPFKTTHLLALLYKTSTKSLNGEGGTTGKYGTGFVTTHILSRKLNISGIHENSSGRRRFDLIIDRNIASQDENLALQLMQQSLADTFNKIDSINKKPAEEIQSEWQTFTYPLVGDAYIYAEKGIQELEPNVAFTLLINPCINSISIERVDSTKTYVASPHDTLMPGISFLSTSQDTGLLFSKSDKLTIAMAARQDGENYTLLPIEKQSILYKEFPLIGTENFNLPVFIQHSDFHPTEQRDGIRTKKILETEADPVADKNRAALAEFVVAYLLFVKTMLDARIGNSFLFAKSGLPQFVEKYSNIEWYQKTIQIPIRSFILEQEVVKTAHGRFRKIAEIRFPEAHLFNNDEFYDLTAELISDLVPDKESIWRWCEIISQESQSWPTNISINEEELVKLIPQKLDRTSESGIEWLKRLYAYLEANNLNHWGEKNPIYLNEANNFCVRDKVSIHPDIDDEFKIVSKGLGKPLDDEFLNRKLGKANAIKEFDLKEFYTFLNKELISDLKIDKATPEQINAIFRICTLFRSDRAVRRDKWYDIAKQLLPSIVGDKKMVVVDYENYWRSAELWAIKYISSLIEKAQKPTVFAATYFQSNESSCFEWLKDFLTFVFELEEENRDVLLKRNIIPTEADIFKPYTDQIFAEDGIKYFDDTIKNIYRDYTNKGDPRQFIVDRRVHLEYFRTYEVSILTDEIDKLFQVKDIETKLKKDGGEYNEMFLQLNNWFEQFQNSASLLRTFDARRSYFYVIALGEGFSKQVMEMKKTGRTIEQITELAKTKLTNQEVKQLGDAAAILGAHKILEKANEMLKAKEQVDRWKRIGDAAEFAFEEAVTNLDFQYEITNPDVGRDFELIINTTNYCIEIKSVAEGKENVRMSIKQGRTAVDNKKNYALCVVTRPDDEEIEIDKEYFINNSQFVTDIGEQIGDKIQNWDQGLETLQAQADIKVQLEDKTESVYINRNIWRSGMPFKDFLDVLSAIAANIETAEK